MRMSINMGESDVQTEKDEQERKLKELETGI